MKIKIMAVDDEPIILDLLGSMLETLGFEVIKVEDSREALERLAVEKVDGLFVDLRMPHLDGLELAQRTRALKLNGKVPIVMLTGSDDAVTMRKGFDAGVSFFLGKPFSRERVYNLLKATTGPMKREQLRYARVPFRTTVSCTWGYPGAGHFTSDSKDLSEGGMHLGPLGGLKVGQALGLAFSLPDIPKKLSVSAQVVREALDDEHGVMFVNLPEWELAAIRQYISARLKD